MFYIGFTSTARSDEEGWRHAEGELTLGRERERFQADLGTWSTRETERPVTYRVDGRRLAGVYLCPATPCLGVLEEFAGRWARDRLRLDHVPWAALRWSTSASSGSVRHVALAAQRNAALAERTIVGGACGPTTWSARR